MARVMKVTPEGEEVVVARNLSWRDACERAEEFRVELIAEGLAGLITDADDYYAVGDEEDYQRA
jgi:hypothetical protein